MNDNRLNEKPMNTRLRRLPVLLIAALVLTNSYALPAQSAVPGLKARQIKIQGGDMLQVNVFDEPQLTTSVRVSPNGEITLPLVGSVTVAGKTPEAAAAELTDLFQSRKILLHPQVAILISEYATAGVSVVGEVKNPGVYTLLGDHTLLDAIAAAGGLTATADSTVLLKHRGSDEQTVSVPLLVDNAGMAASRDVPVYPNDLVVVPRVGLVYVLGDVAKPGGFTMRTDGHMTLLQAISQAQGTNKTAALHNVKLLRRHTDGTLLTTDVPLKQIEEGKSEDIALLANDVIFVPNSAIKTSAATLAGFGGAIATAVIYTH